MSTRLGPRPTALVAAGLLVVSLVLLLATMRMGYTRDESFYFQYAESYRDWLTRLEQADTPGAVKRVLGRGEVLKTWRGNFEHPPLMKFLFGEAWRYLARKDRELVLDAAAGGRARVVGLGPSDGFAEGTGVAILAPLEVGESPTDARRRVATGTVRSRSQGAAEIAFESAQAGSELRGLCSRRAPPSGDPSLKRSVPRMTRCQARDLAAAGWVDEATAMRAAGALSGALVVMLTFLLGQVLLSWRVGLFAALAFLFVPRFFFHAHLAAFDMGIVAASMAVLYAYWRSLTDRRWALAAGVAWGLAILTKHNAFFLPVPLVLHWLWSGRGEIRLSWGRGIRLPRLPLAFLTMPLVALTMLFVFWPRLWVDPFVALSDYFSFHLEHVNYMALYFGQPLQVPPFPFSVPFSLTWFTVPEGLSVLTLAGLVVATRPWRWAAWLRGLARLAPATEHERATSFALLNGLIPVLLIALPSVPIFGGVKHWMTGMPLLLLFAGVGFEAGARWLLSGLSSRAWRWAATWTLAAAVLAAPAWASVRSVPFGTSYYNRVFAGGLQGAADRRMMRLYWGHTIEQALPWLNRHAKLGARVYFQNGTTQAFDFYRRAGLLRRDLRFQHGARGADVALVEPQKSFAQVDIETREALGVAGPRRLVRDEGVPLLRVYARPGALIP